MFGEQLKINVLSVLIGALTMLLLVLLSGATMTPGGGKYQMEAVVRERITQVYVMDTTTGVVKWVDKMNTPFEEMKGK